MPEQPPEDGVVYVIVYVPGALVDGVIDPVVVLIVKPDGAELYVPPVYEPVPVKVTDWAVETDEQNEFPLYEILAVGVADIVTVVVVLTEEHPPDAGDV
jgi:hypothetical protein